MDELKIEQERVYDVIEKIERTSNDLRDKMQNVASDIIHIRKNFWEDVRVNFDNADDALETHMSLRQQTELLSERERSHQHSNSRLRVLEKLTYTPYFGRIDFLEEGEKDVDCLYIGIGSFHDEETDQFLVYDWRAPICSLYYDSSLGHASFKAPNGTIEGDIQLKRQYVIRNGQIRSMFDTGVTIGDEILQEVLGNNSDAHMKSIVATIQKEQNKIIRDEKHRILIVQGAAGSGKTSAALQRVAYLLYRYRDSLQADQILMFSPNPLFASYVSTVLPELGEENMQQATFQQFVGKKIEKHLHVEDPFSQMEDILSSPNNAKVEEMQVKASMDFMHMIDKYVTQLQHDGIVFKDITFRGRTLLSAEQLTTEFYAMDHSTRIPNRMRLLAEWVMKELRMQERKERQEAWVEEEMQLLNKEDYMDAYHKTQESDNEFTGYEQEQNLLAAQVVADHFKSLYKRVKRLRFVDSFETYKQLFTRSTELPKEMCDRSLGRLNENKLSYEDATAYLYVKEVIEGLGRNASVRHLFIDEAQDYSPFQLAYLKKLFPHCKMTLLGDLHQTIHIQAMQTNFLTGNALFDPSKTETIILKRSYRSTEQIIDFTRSLIPGGHEIEPFNRKGSKPLVVNTTNIQQQVENLKKHGHGTIAIICKTEKETKEVYEEFGKSMSLSMIEKETTSLQQGVLVMPSYLAKGMEFDAVIVYDASNYVGENERNLFYTVCTRAMHELVICYTGGMSDFLKEVPASLYEHGR
ncbi:RNA polymerase recycling motor HelD [Priestia taiwanensis]|uniref:Helicase IV n=1 Tax=Priestia taiwanensis TaxID=1347902 RepID=A0A917ENG4_9BACI|nr:RNA polymerase recycling motor HelD [Priestia taiwanensis]MBM7362112.1 DNA helicase-2/ATP-dependent DNA helicase PcrA [Priestia taiwanensis]GGE59576.1 helicase IV [Priestia taiwanensis]